MVLRRPTADLAFNTSSLIVALGDDDTASSLVGLNSQRQQSSASSTAVVADTHQRSKDV